MKVASDTPSVPATSAAPCNGGGGTGASGDAPAT
jgi:hypothetical protein